MNIHELNSRKEVNSRHLFETSCNASHSTTKTHNMIITSVFSNLTRKVLILISPLFSLPYFLSSFLDRFNESSDKNFTCALCLRRYSKLSCLKRHVRYECVKNPNRIFFKCPYCNHTSKRRDSLTQHILSLHLHSKTLIKKTENWTETSLYWTLWFRTLSLSQFLPSDVTFAL